MVCYTIPAMAAIVHYILRKNMPRLKKSKCQGWLNLLLAGGAIFGVVDHLWNGELFLLGENLVMDILLGITITIVLFAVWAAMVTLDKTKAHKLSGNLN